MRYLQQEEFRTILLDSKNHIMHIDYTSKGILNAIVVHPREVFGEAIKRRCSSIIVAHNHPSGDAMPSDRDKQVTERLVMVGDIIGIPVLDHVILGRGYYSFKEGGLINHDHREVYTE